MQWSLRLHLLSPAFCFNQVGDVERSQLRPGNVHSADGWRELLEPVVARYRSRKLKLYFRADAAFANPEVYAFPEAEGFKYAIRLPANQVLQESIAYLLKRPIGRPPNEIRRYHARFSYQAGTWDKPRRVGAKVVRHGRSIVFQMGEIAVPRSLFAEVLRLIDGLRPRSAPS